MSAFFVAAGAVSDEKSFYVASAVAGWTSLVAFAGAVGKGLENRHAGRDSIVASDFSSGSQNRYVRDREEPPVRERLPYIRGPQSKTDRPKLTYARPNDSGMKYTRF